MDINQTALALSSSSAGYCNVCVIHDGRGYAVDSLACMYIYSFARSLVRLLIYPFVVSFAYMISSARRTAEHNPNRINSSIHPIIFCDTLIIWAYLSINHLTTWLLYHILYREKEWGEEKRQRDSQSILMRLKKAFKKKKKCREWESRVWLIQGLGSVWGRNRYG